MVRVSKAVWENFEFNLNRARALAQAQHYLEVFAEEGEQAAWKYINRLFAEIFRWRDFDLGAIIKKKSDSAAIPIQEELKRRLEGKPAERLTRRLETFGKTYDELPWRIRKLLEPIMSLGLLTEQTLVEGAVVLAVAAYEAFLKDVIRAEALKKPSIVGEFPHVEKQAYSPALRRYSGKIRIAKAELLAESLESHHTTSVRSYFKRIYRIENVFEAAPVERAVSRFIQIRHLIVHNGGIVSPDFRRKTKWKTQRIGDRIELPYRSVLRQIETIRRFGKQVKDA